MPCGNDMIFTHGAVRGTTTYNPIYPIDISKFSIGRDPIKKTPLLLFDIETKLIALMRKA